TVLFVLDVDERSGERRLQAVACAHGEPRAFAQQQEERVVLDAAQEADDGGGDGVAARAADVVLTGAERAEVEGASADGGDGGLRGAAVVVGTRRAAAAQLDGGLRDTAGAVADLAAQRGQWRRRAAGVGNRGGRQRRVGKRRVDGD